MAVEWDTLLFFAALFVVVHAHGALFGAFAAVAFAAVGTLIAWHALAAAVDPPGALPAHAALAALVLTLGVVGGSLAAAARRMRAALRDMLPRKWGRIINVSSMYGKLPVPGVSTYATTKAAINGLTRVVAHEVGAEGVTVNALCPGFVETDNLLDNGPGAAEANGMTYEAWLEVVLAPSAIKRMNTVEECGAVAVLLASEEGGGITGSSINIDGGTSPY